MSDQDKATCKYENIDYLKTAVLEWLSEEKSGEFESTGESK